MTPSVSADSVTPIQQQLPVAARCTGCSACSDICPRQCIEMRENAWAEIVPVIDEQHCIRCGLCVNTCPVNYPQTLQMPQQTIACWSTNMQWRKKSASGGIGTLMAEMVVAANGIVYGAVYDENMQVVCCRGTTKEDLELMRGSKYAQMEMRHAYRKIAEDLHTGAPVLFVGTPCQIAGVRAFFKQPQPNLILVDLICHGVAPGRYLQQEVKLLRQQYRFHEITDCRFRGNDKHNFAFTLWHGDRLLYRRPARGQFYFHAFLAGISLRECCFSCPYAQSERVGDFTIGDFFGLGKFAPFPYFKDNVSLITVNSADKARWLDDVLRQSTDFRYVEREYQEAIAGGISLREPFSRHPLQPFFRKKYVSDGWRKATRMLLWKQVIVGRIKFSPVSYLWRIPRKIYRMTRGLFS